MSFILFLFVIILLLILSVLSFGISMIRGILSIFFPSLRRTANSSFGGQNTHTHHTQDEPTSSKRKKIFDRSEGDYAEYEEIKK
ncbi:MAG: hypothetical protein PHV20_09655 [Bacteroidales bacterium]|nr:hypothetical protein [Bacteroidales bacterium]